MSPLEGIVDFYENLAPGDLCLLKDYYADDAYFKDPFNEVQSVDEIEAIFRRMFEQVDAPRFRVTGRIEGRDDAALVWEMHFRFRGKPEEQKIRGMTHLRFGPDGRVTRHRDYWDAAEELYEKLPLLGGLLRAVKRRV